MIALSLSSARRALAATIVAASIAVSGFSPLSAQTAKARPATTIYGAIASQPNAIAKLQSCVAVITGESFTPAIAFDPASAVKSSTVTFSFFDKANVALGQMSLSPPYTSQPVPAGTETFTCAIAREELADGSVFPAAAHNNTGLIAGGIVGVGLIAALAGGHGGTGSAPGQTATPVPNTPTPFASTSPTPRVTVSPTLSPTAVGATPTPSPVAATPTASASPRPSATPSPTPSMAATASPSATPTVIASPTASATASAGPMATASPTATPTASPTATPTPSPTPTASPTATPTASPTDTPTASPTDTPTPSPTPTASPTAAPTPSPTPTASSIGPLTIAPNPLLFIANNVTQPVTIAELGYGGTFSLQSQTCASGGTVDGGAIATVSPNSAVPNPGTLAVTSLESGQCSFTFTDTNGNSAVLSIDDTATTLIINRKHRSGQSPATPPTATVPKPTPQPGAAPHRPH